MHNALQARDLVFAASLSLDGALIFDLNGIMLDNWMEWMQCMGGIPFFACIESYGGFWIRYQRMGILFILHPTRSWLCLNCWDNIESQKEGKVARGSVIARNSGEMVGMVVIEWVQLLIIAIPRIPHDLLQHGRHTIFNALFAIYTSWMHSHILFN